MGAIANGLFNSIFRRNYVFLSTVFVGAFAFEMYGNPAEFLGVLDADKGKRAFDTGTDALWNSINRGRQWRDIKQKYMAPPEDDE